MKIQIEDSELKELLLLGTSNKYKALARDKRFMEALGRAYRLLEVVRKANGLRPYSFLHYEQLKGSRNSSIRIMNGRVERLVFEEIDDGVEIISLELDREHYGNKK